MTSNSEALLQLSATDDVATGAAHGAAHGTGSNTTTVAPTQHNITLRLSQMDNVAPTIQLPYEVVMDEGTTHSFDMKVQDLDGVVGHAIKLVISAEHGAIRLPEGIATPTGVEIDTVGPDPINSPSLSVLGDLKAINGMEQLIHYVPHADFHGEDHILAGSIRGLLHQKILVPWNQFFKI